MESMIQDIRTALTSNTLGLTWDDLSQQPLSLDQAVSWLQLDSVELFPNKPPDFIVSGRVIYWSESLDQAEGYILEVIAYLGEYLLGKCLPGVNRVQLSNISVAYSGAVEDSDLASLETYTLSLTFSLVLSQDRLN